LPRRPQGKIDLAVTVDIVRLNTHVIAIGGPLDDRVLLPPRVGEPDDRVLGHRHDVRLAVAVDVGHRKRITDIADVRVDLLEPDLRKLRRPDRDGRQKGGAKTQHNRSRARQRHDREAPRSWGWETTARRYVTSSLHALDHK